MSDERTRSTPVEGARVDRKPHLLHFVAGEGYLSFRVECLAGDDPDRACRAADGCLAQALADDLSGDPEMLRLPEEHPIDGSVAVLPVIHEGDDEAEVEFHLWSHRPWTPDEKLVGEDGRAFTRFKVKTACSGCGALIGDVTDDEIAGAIEGRPLGDTTAECPYCSGRFGNALAEEVATHG